MRTRILTHETNKPIVNLRFWRSISVSHIDFTGVVKLFASKNIPQRRTYRRHMIIEHVYYRDNLIFYEILHVQILLAGETRVPLYFNNKYVLGIPTSIVYKNNWRNSTKTLSNIRLRR